MITMYQVIQFLDLAKIAQDDLKTTRNKAERIGLPECAKAIDAVIVNLTKAVGIVHRYEVKQRE